MTAPRRSLPGAARAALPFLVAACLLGAAAFGATGSPGGPESGGTGAGGPASASGTTPRAPEAAGPGGGAPEPGPGGTAVPPAPADPAVPRGGASPPGPLPPNELGRIMVLEYHAIGPREGRWARTPENLRRDLEALYRRGYRPVNMSDVVDRRLDLPRGFSPVVLTFDDGTVGQFRLLEQDGRRVPDPSSAVGVLLAFHEEHPDWPLRATFYVNAVPFGERDTWREKVRLLRQWGMEVGNHTLGHTDLSRLDAAATAREVGGLDALLAQADPGLRTETLALPYGGLPRAPEAARGGSYDGHAYAIKAFLLVGAGPAPSPHDPVFDPYRIPRIQAVDPAFEARATFDFWLRYFDEHPEQRYVSDGDPSRVAAPAAP